MNDKTGFIVIGIIIGLFFGLIAKLLYKDFLYQECEAELINQDMPRSMRCRVAYQALVIDEFKGDK